MNVVDAVMAWFSARRRAAIYYSLGLLTIVLIAIGVLTDAEAAEWMDIGQKVLALLASIIALLRLTPDSPPPPFDVEDPDAPPAV